MRAAGPLGLGRRPSQRAAPGAQRRSLQVHASLHRIRQKCTQFKAYPSVPVAVGLGNEGGDQAITVALFAVHCLRVHLPPLNNISAAQTPQS